MKNIVEILDKTSRIEDQILISMTRVSRTSATLSRLIEAMRQEATGDQEKAVLDRLSDIAAKFMAIVGTR